MDIIAAYREAGTYRGAAEIAGTTHKTARWVIARHEAGGAAPGRAARGHNYDDVAGLVAGVEKTAGRISAKRLLPAARAEGFSGPDRNFRRLVAQAKADWRRDHHRGRRPAVWSPGEHLVIDWGALGGLHVFCAVLAWSRFRFVRFAADERAETTLGMLAECFDVLGGVPGKVLADRMGCLKGGVVANVVVPAGHYVRFASHYGFRPGSCEAADPESEGVVENLVGYAKRDLMVPQAPFAGLAAANGAAAAWCAEVNGAVHSETCSVPAERLVTEQELLGPRPAQPQRAVRPRTAAEKEFCALGPVTEAFITGAAAAGCTRLGPELAELNTLRAAHGEETFAAALDRAVAFSRWRAADVRSILAAGVGLPATAGPGNALALQLPAVPVRPLSDYAIRGLA
jgi:transposase